MHRHPGTEEIFYVIEGRCLFYVDKEKKLIEKGNAVYVPADSRHAVLSCERGATLISVQGPQPVMSIYGKLEYFCPACGLETPLPEGTATGDLERCPRCKIWVRLFEAGVSFAAEPVDKEPGEEARA